MNRLLNGDFASGTDNWDNGPANYPFDWTAGYIYGESPSGNSDLKTFDIQQEINVTDTVIAAKITAWRRYESTAGNYVNGTVRSKVLLQKPDTSWVTLADETKTGENGWGNVLDQYDVLAHFSQQGNYKLRLATEVRSACERTNTQDKIEEPYGPWSNGGFTISDPNCYIQSYGYSQAVKYAYIEKQISVYGTPHTATVTLDARGAVDLYCQYQGYARFKATLSKAGGGGPWSLYDGYLSDGNWATIINALDIKSYMSSAGTYTLTLEAWVKSGYDGGTTYYPSEAWFGNCELNAEWYSYTYTVSRGYWDDIVLDINIKKYKTVVEFIGAGEATGKKISVPKKEDIFLAESYQTLSVILKTVSEDCFLAESYFKKIYKLVLEEIGLQEFYQHGLGFAVAEDCFLAEAYSTRKKILGSQSESVSLSERLSAKKTAGNIITTFEITDLTEWETAAPTVTAWIKEKTVMNT